MRVQSKCTAESRRVDVAHRLGLVTNMLLDESGELPGVATGAGRSCTALAIFGCNAEKHEAGVDCFAICSARPDVSFQRPCQFLAIL